MSYGWEKVVKEAKATDTFKITVNICDECYTIKFPYGIIYDGVEGNCPHLFARKAKNKLDDGSNQKVME